MAIASLAFLTPGNYLDHDPSAGLEDTLRLIEFGERSGYRGAWVRQRHLEHGISSAAVFLAAASQRTSTIELGTAVIPIGYENPFRLAEDLSLADALSGGRIQAGFSTGMPHAELLADIVFDGDWRGYELGHARVARTVEHLRGAYLGGPDTRIESPGNVQRPRLQPHTPGLAERAWYGGTSLASVRWTGETGLHLLTGNIVSAAGIDSDDFGTVQRRLIDEYRAAGGSGRRVAVGRVIVPTDGADRATARRYRDYARSRYDRTLRAHGDKRTLFAEDLVGPVAEIAERLADDPALGGVTELRLELPYEFDVRDYEQILTDALSLVPRIAVA
ncbi:Luciferase-like, subgroup OS=Tsukamurella paurometabola (strain ATCC 8368 / DSM / CCUG 35730/ CIP 100753 / JCM 10117 / KCTC 9821 / NBRC 16120 / NCIMB 702349/ NCTC 13040) OX=521096 GN=Tpau_1985 PE=4 SV=1 [Tsukamurella paurometabola]|uniref:Luciferase-like, subgroup n=1 Tax=Tsukamurella paurometabola (strain ATCC 8368 / DSM 20162 / CCUG 35730 / CIP 100753 / JCM 10117 / KCTC 9821 / NBRC 16120 / NCIMB 702349 / NCTC 13040) TaxID=521096 RepID=D5UNM9_TSUPD|nr:LLM class flavin-dependent oxidoreductase [Tsukamurella paurometabola]ADG78597.1 Luciferase-like, subgroup [Tsukamurella paurometabola DSM 20162]SUP32361.1 Limonene 1,2-monooxygenase [Tsukamurella paurometabola]